MELYEQLVTWYLTKDRHVFVSPQYSIRGEKGEWACPDVVALDFRRRTVIVAEVSTGWRTKALLEKVKNREAQWIEKLRTQLLSLNVIDDAWTFEVWVFVREHAVKQFEEVGVIGGTPVRVHPLEKLGNPWDWPRE